MALVVAGALLFRRRAPFVAPLVASAGAIAFTLVDPAGAYDTSTLFFVLLLAAWAAGALIEPRRAAIAIGAVLLAGWMVLLRAPGVPWTEALWFSLPLAGVFGLSAVAARHSERARSAEERARRSEEEASRAVHEERNRITRELHDVLAHSVSVMTVQASAVRRRLTPEQEREREALLTVEETGRQALAEMRRLVGIMRTEEDSVALTPQPGLETLPALVEQVRQSGLPVELSVEGEPVKLPAGRRPLRLPDRAGGPDEHAQARRPRACLGGRPLRGRRRRDRGRERRAQHRRRRRRQGTASSACASASRSAAASSTRVRAPAAVIASRRACRWQDLLCERQSSDRRRPSARARRLQDDPRVGAGDRDRGRGRGRIAGDRGSADARARTSS